MKYFAQLEKRTNKVTNIIIIDDNDCLDGSTHSEAVGASYAQFKLGGNWKEYSPTGEFRNRPAMIGGYYDESLDSFVDEKPDGYDSWSLNSTGEWTPPSPPGNVGIATTAGWTYHWNEKKYKEDPNTAWEWINYSG